MKAGRFAHAGLAIVCLLLVKTSEVNAQVTAITAGKLIDPETGTEKKQTDYSDRGGQDQSNRD